MRSFRDIPIRRKLMVIIMLTTTAALALSGLGVIVSDSLLLHASLERGVSSLAQIVAENSTAAVAFEDPRAAAEILATLRARTHLVSTCIYRANGTILASYFRPGTIPKCAPADPQHEIRFTGEDLTVSRPIVLNNQRIGWLVLLYDLGEIYERRILYGATVLAVLIASSLIAILLASKLSAVIATPLSRLVQATSAVSETRDYGIRAPRLSGDELGSLVDAFNGMLAGIQTRDHELRQALMAREEALRKAQNARDSSSKLASESSVRLVKTRSAPAFASAIAKY